jgi:hypothetical protein
VGVNFECVGVCVWGGGCWTGKKLHQCATVSQFCVGTWAWMTRPAGNARMRGGGRSNPKQPLSVLFAVYHAGRDGQLVFFPISTETSP